MAFTCGLSKGYSYSVVDKFSETLCLQSIYLGLSFPDNLMDVGFFFVLLETISGTMLTYMRDPVSTGKGPLMKLIFTVGDYKVRVLLSCKDMSPG